MSAYVCNPEITSVVVYGSHARGDLDSESDLDICVFTQGRVKVEMGRTDVAL